MDLVSVIAQYVPRDRHGGDSAGLSDGDGSGLGVASPVKHLRKLSAFSRTCLSDDYHNGILFHCLDDFLFELDDWKIGRHC